MPSFRSSPVDVVIDVRSVMEFWMGHLEGAKNVSVDKLPDGLDGLGLTKQSRILLYCASGARSAHAAAALRQAGYTRVVDGGAMSQANQHYRAA